MRAYFHRLALVFGALGGPWSNLFLRAIASFTLPVFTPGLLFPAGFGGGFFENGDLNPREPSLNVLEVRFELGFDFGTLGLLNFGGVGPELNFCMGRGGGFFGAGFLFQGLEAGFFGAGFLFHGLEAGFFGGKVGAAFLLHGLEAGFFGGKAFLLHGLEAGFAAGSLGAGFFLFKNAGGDFCFAGAAFLNGAGFLKAAAGGRGGIFAEDFVSVLSSSFKCNISSLIRSRSPIVGFRPAVSAISFCNSLSKLLTFPFVFIGGAFFGGRGEGGGDFFFGGAIRFFGASFGGEGPGDLRPNPK